MFIRLLILPPYPKKNESFNLVFHISFDPKKNESFNLVLNDTNLSNMNQLPIIIFI